MHEWRSTVLRLAPRGAHPSLRWGPWTRRGGPSATVPALIATAALVIAGCGSGRAAPTATTVDPVRVATAITSAVSRQRHVTATVTCPTGIPLHQGRAFYCVAQTGSRLTTFRVDEITAGGDVRFRGLSLQDVPQLDTAGIAAAITQSIKRARGIAASVRCPHGMPRQAGLSFACTATYGSHQTTVFEVSQLNDMGRVSYRAL